MEFQHYAKNRNALITYSGILYPIPTDRVSWTALPARDTFRPLEESKGFIVKIVLRVVSRMVGYHP